MGRKLRKIRLYFYKVLRFFKKVWDKFRDDEDFLKAQALSYSSILAFIPVTFVALWIIPTKIFLDPLKERIQAILVSIFIPQAAQRINAYITEFLSNAQSLGIFGAVSFIVTSVMFLETVDRAFGDIWGIRKRSFWVRLALFWAFVTVPPILMGVSIYLNYLIKSRITFHFIELIYIPLPYVFVVLALTLVYAVFPSADVSFKYALGGGLFAGVLWHIAKYLFSWYAYRTITYKTIYGSLWLIPVFIFWLYIVWTIVLLGAEVAYVLQWPAGRGKRSFYRIMLLLRSLYLNLLHGKKPLKREVAMRACGIKREEFETLLSEMEKKGWILECEDGITLARLPDRIPVSEIIVMSGIFEEGWDKRMNMAVNYVKNRLSEKMDFTLGELFEKVCGIPHRPDSSQPCKEPSESPA